MKKLISVIVLATLALFISVPANALRGDLNGDNDVNVLDITALINYILGSNYTTVDPAAADINGDNEVDVRDVTALISLILNGEPNPHDYVWDHSALPEIHITVSLDEWNRLLDLYDENSGTKQYIMASHFTFIKNGTSTEIDSIGLRLKGNTSRRRPEGSRRGQHHQANRTDWHHVHFGINLRKYHKDEDHTINSIRKLHLKWFKDDPAYCREMYCYNLFRDFGVWTASRDVYCRLWLKVEGDSQETYYGIYEMIEPVDENYLKDRQDASQYGTAKGNLWKCKYVSGKASLTEGYNGDYWYDDDTDANHTYTLQTNTKRFDNAKSQIIDFQLKLNGKGRDSFYTWINEVCDVDLLLKTYAVNVAVGMWDDYWNNSNNYYLYFTTEDIYNYKVYLIPYDYDNTLGTSLNCGVQTDAGRHDPLNWGVDNPLIKRILEFDDFKAKYIGYLQELADPNNNYFHFNASTKRIKAWQNKIMQYVGNDTGEDTVIEDRPASWGNHPEYRLLEDGENNFFRVKTQVIEAL